MNPLQQGYRIGEVAKTAGVHVETVRFYERQGLIPQPVKPHLGIRRYPQDTIARIRFIKHAQRLGFTLQEVRELLALRINEAHACDTVHHQAQIKLSSVHEKIQALQRLETVLARLIEGCEKERSGSYHGCPILQSLETVEIITNESVSKEGRK
ncbi:MerR family transcriptional regulator [Acidithiobacillus ferriphilus]|nr:MerR family transcriptional regulator [Acidithiobacillus ferriphilus]